MINGRQVTGFPNFSRRGFQPRRPDKHPLSALIIDVRRGSFNQWRGAKEDGGGTGQGETAAETRNLVGRPDSDTRFPGNAAINDLSFGSTRLTSRQIAGHGRGSHLCESLLRKAGVFALDIEWKSTELEFVYFSYRNYQIKFRFKRGA